MANARLALPFLILFFLLWAAPNEPPVAASSHQRFTFSHTIERERASLNVLNESRYGDFIPQHGKKLNLTGFHEDAGYAWLAGPGDFFEKVKKKAFNGRLRTLKISDGDLAFGEPGEDQPLYQNVTGYTLGNWVRSNLEKDYVQPSINLSAVLPEGTYSSNKYQWNITGESGEIGLLISEKGASVTNLDRTVREVNARLTIYDELSSGEGWAITLHGVHFAETGGLILTSTSEKFAGIFGLPHLALDNKEFELSKSLLNKTLTEKIAHRETRLDGSTNPWASTPDHPGESLFPLPHCEFVLYLQQFPAENVPASPLSGGDKQKALAFYEEDLRHPKGFSHSPLPPLRFYMTMFSPDCGFALESKGPPDYTSQDGKHLEGLKEEVFVERQREVVLLYGMVSAAQVWLMLRQCKETSTPSTRSRVSFYTIAMLNMGDGAAQIAFLTGSMLYGPIYLALLIVSFFAFIAVNQLNIRFMVDIWIVQSPERRRRQPPNATRTQPNPQAAPQPANTNRSSSPGLPLPATARTDGATPVILPPDQDEDPATTTTTATQTNNTTPSRREFGSFFSRFYFLLFVLIFLSINASSWPPPAGLLYLALISTMYLSFWVPQLFRNTVRNCRRALRWEFVIGQSVLRLLPFFYLLGMQDNIFQTSPQRGLLMFLCSWVSLQVVLLAAQSVIGPRFCIPSTWLPQAYDYHPVLKDDMEDGNMPIGVKTADPQSPETAKSPTDSGKRNFDCAICMQNLEVLVVETGEEESAARVGLLARRAYMVTPCRHIFHTNCLEGWMRYRLQCPVCRETLPPL
ncbi:hypothetical protein M501DRAFT_956698 [Patellaria atrata CBS 101060]|uniref:DSC E3 ubiquitin ligase complex subunit A n=1 Tax=Patellaria atrata CBS 101060 TaxID=1346257 RepID=A0A9P4VS90_9PEZI|nr:hypothetical protein M501DRAFT_956698 [Patellaria atrata CBS 101060]